MENNLKSVVYKCLYIMCEYAMEMEWNKSRKY